MTPSGDRTHGHQTKNPALCQLSYRGVLDVYTVVPVHKFMRPPPQVKASVTPKTGAEKRRAPTVGFDALIRKAWNGFA